ncbi:DUF2079 domain-containing protein [Streptomyces sp. RKAG337]|uniref:DUF2079 domain-containing protein n=1 Tax=Streptomyces sp. RKAG337 TaxID=2893404 RepID=UPI0020338386|nr:DUF2079 domain-containing protein [Streptomyces sp. RKAG337]MCM2428043.1 DUF2079 domain-containing protein [Streptomyces sp. RKAG337]
MDMATAAIPAQHGSSAAAGTRVQRLFRPKIDPYWLAGALFVAYATLSVCRFRRMATMSWDLGIFEQAIKSYAHFQAPVADLKGPGTNILGDHFSPITALVAPFYRVFPSPVTLLVVQAALFALSVVPVTRVGAHFLGRGRGLAVGVAYGLSWGVQRAIEFDFHEIAFAMPMLAFSLEAVLRKRWKTAMWWALPLILVKEDMGATVAAIGVVVLLRTRREDPRTASYAIWLIGFGLAFAAIAFGVLIPAFNNSGGYDYWNKLGGSGAPVAGTIPPDTALRTLLWILLPTSGLLALRSPLLIAALPTIGWRFISHDDHYWGLDWHYSAVLMPVVFLALVDAVNESRDSPRGWLRSYASQLPAAAAAAALALSTTLPLADLTHTATYRPGAHVKAVEKLLRQIPDGASVEANVGPISRLVNRCTVYWIGGAKNVVPDYIAIDNGDGWVPDPVEYAHQLHPSAAYTEIANSEGYVILRRG